MTLPLSTEVFIAMPVSQPPKEEGLYCVINDEGHYGMKHYQPTGWLNMYPGITHYLQKKSVLDVLGSLEIPRWIDIESGKRPPQEEQVFWDGGEGPPAWGRYRKDKRFEYVVLIDSSGEEELYSISEYTRWLDEGNLSDLLSKVAGDAYDKGFADCMESDSPDKAQYLERFKTTK